MVLKKLFNKTTNKCLISQSIILPWPEASDNRTHRADVSTLGKISWSIDYSEIK